MAMIGDIMTEYGINVTYHIIHFYGWNKFGDLDVIVTSYVNQGARLALNSPLLQNFISISRAEHPELFVPTGDIKLAEIYGIVSKNEIFINTQSDVVS